MDSPTFSPAVDTDRQGKWIGTWGAEKDVLLFFRDRWTKQKAALCPTPTVVRSSFSFVNTSGRIIEGPFG